MRRSRNAIEEAYHRFCLERLAGRPVQDAACAVEVSRATGYRFERRRVGVVTQSYGRWELQVVRTSTRVKIAGDREREAVRLWLEGLTYPQLAEHLGISVRGAQRAIERLWYSTRWHAIMARLEELPAPPQRVTRHCPQCGFVTSFPNCPRCSRPGRRGSKIATVAAD